MSTLLFAQILADFTPSLVWGGAEGLIDSSVHALRIIGLSPSRDCVYDGGGLIMMCVHKSRVPACSATGTLALRCLHIPVLKTL